LTITYTEPLQRNYHRITFKTVSEFIYSLKVLDFW